MANRDVVNVRWPKNVTITRPVLNDDSGNTGNSVLTEKVTFNEGDPVVQHRFPLSKIQLLLNPLAKTQSSNPPAAGATTGTIAWAVRYYFGLKWVLTDGNLNEPHWQYQNAIQPMNEPGTTDGTYGGGGLKNLNSIHEVAAFGTREPDFFELLYAGKLKGSGVTVAGAGLYFDIGANIIDQFDPDDIPAVVSAGHIWFGRENLPYIFQVLLWPYRPTSDPNRNTFEAYLVPELWNPHRNAATPSSTFTNLRMIVYQTRGGKSCQRGPARDLDQQHQHRGRLEARVTEAISLPNSPAVLKAPPPFIPPITMKPTVLIPPPTPFPSALLSYLVPPVATASMDQTLACTYSRRPAIIPSRGWCLKIPLPFRSPPSSHRRLRRSPIIPPTAGSALNDGESVNRIGFYLGYTTNAPDQLITKATAPNSYPTNTTVQIFSHTSACSLSYRMQYSIDNGANWNTYEWISVDMSSANLQYANDWCGEPTAFPHNPVFRTKMETMPSTISAPSPPACSIPA